MAVRVATTSCQATREILTDAAEKAPATFVQSERLDARRAKVWPSGAEKLATRHGIQRGQALG